MNIVINRPINMGDAMMLSRRQRREGTQNDCGSKHNLFAPHFISRFQYQIGAPQSPTQDATEKFYRQIKLMCARGVTFVTQPCRLQVLIKGSCW